MRHGRITRRRWSTAAVFGLLPAALVFIQAWRCAGVIDCCRGQPWSKTPNCTISSKPTRRISWSRSKVGSKLLRPVRHRGGSAARRGLSAEQIPVLVVEDREGHHFDTVVPKVDLPTVGCLLAQVLAPDALLCTDGAGVYRAMARQFELAHESVNVTAGQQVCQQIFHVQQVNAYDSRLKQWIRRFNGVATHYLPNYLGWRRLIECCARKITPEILLRHAVAYNQRTSRTVTTVKAAHGRLYCCQKGLVGSSTDGDGSG